MTTLDRIITLTSDFGTDSPYVAQMKAAILQVNPRANLIDITHAIPPQDIHQAAWVLVDGCHLFPPKTVHLVVVDPGVGSDRHLLAVMTNDQYFVCPDNGLLTGLLADTETTHIHRLEHPIYWRRDPSNTFHGRDIMGPVAAHLSLGVGIEQLGPPLETYRRIAWPQPRVIDCEIRGTVQSIDAFGNLITEIPAALLQEVMGGVAITVEVAGQQIQSLARHYAQSEVGATVALIGSHGRLEVAVVGGHAARSLETQVGAEVRVHRQKCP